MSSIRTVKFIGETRLCYSAEFDGHCYNLRVTASPAVVESAFVSDVARDAETAERLCELFARNLVFPGNVYEILDDLLGSGFFK